MIKKRLFLIAVLLLSACDRLPPLSQVMGKTPPFNSNKTIADLEREGKLPKLDRSISLAGPDLDHNGIRDDIDQYIKVLSAERHYTSEQVMALQQSARAEQALMTVNFNDRKAVLAADQKSTNAIHCAGKLHVDYIEIASLSVNTSQRKKSERAYDHFMDGSDTEIPSVDTCEK